MTPNADTVTLIGDIRALIEMCRNGDFYQDHDLSCEVLGKASDALDALSHITSSGTDA